MNEDLLLEMKKYIEETEIENSREYGLGESLEELIKQDTMPTVYSKILKLLKI